MWLRALDVVVVAGHRQAALLGITVTVALSISGD